MRQRLGEIRYGNSKDGFWSRGFAQENTLRGLGDIDFSQTSYGGSLGYDHLFVQDDNNKWLFGFKAQASRADQKINGDYGAKGDNTAYGFSGYATWNHADGWYGDLVATWDWYNQNLRTRMLDGKRVTGSYKHYGGGLSLELGRTIHLSNDAFIEPQVHEHVRIYGEFEREEGFSFSKPWSVSAGIRYSF